jgi:hypothetical protein
VNGRAHDSLWVQLDAILVGGALGAFFAILSINFFHSTVRQLAYLAACAIFGSIVCAVSFAAFPQRLRGPARSASLANSDSGRLPKPQRGQTADSPPLSPKWSVGVFASRLRFQNRTNDSLFGNEPSRLSIWKKAPGPGYVVCHPRHGLIAPTKKHLGLCARLADRLDHVNDGTSHDR